MGIRLLAENELKIVNELAHKTWPDTFKDILSEEQLNFMLNWMYSLETLETQRSEGHQFFVFEENNIPLGFIGIQQNHPSKGEVKIHKLYVLPAQQGKSIGKKLIQFVKELVKETEISALILNVNRFNNATEFYKKIGFEIIEEIDIEIGNGYLMEDFVMRLQLN